MLVPVFFIFGQPDEGVKIYDPEADAAIEVKMAVTNAKSMEKNVLVMIGFNECPWCIKLNKYVLEDPQIDSLINANYIWIKVNYSKENKNLDIMKDLDFPQRMGFPVIVILNKQGNRIHTQNTWYLEEGKSYDKKKLMNFLKEWNVDAMKESSYKDYQK